MSNENKCLEYNEGMMTLEQRANLDGWREAWIAALRSGKYKQTTGQLRDAKGAMCCLGVLCDVASKTGYGEWHEEWFVLDGLSRKGTAPVCGGYWRGVLVHPYKNGQDLADLNDSIRYTFEQIADVIESRNVRLPNGAIL